MAMAKGFDFEVNERKYKALPMDGFTQFALLSKVSPLLSAGAVECWAIRLRMQEAGVEASDSTRTATLIAILPHVARELAKMSDQDRRDVIGACLSVCERQVDNRWEPIWFDEAGRAQQDIQSDPELMLTIAFEVFNRTFKSFFPESLSSLLGEARSLLSNLFS